IVAHNGPLLSTADAGPSGNRQDLPRRDNLPSAAHSHSAPLAVIIIQQRLSTSVHYQCLQLYVLPVTEYAGKLLSVAFISGHFWVAGEMGALCRGNAEGADWQPLGTGEDVTFNGIRAGVDGDLWIAAEFGQLLRSTNQGQSWTTQELGS